MSKIDWMSAYGTKKLQQGGPMAAAPAATANNAQEEAGGSLEAMLEQFAQTQDPQLAVQICNMLLQAMAQQQGGTPAARMGGKMPARRGPIFKR